MTTKTCGTCGGTRWVWEYYGPDDNYDAKPCPECGAAAREPSAAATRGRCSACGTPCNDETVLCLGCASKDDVSKPSAAAEPDGSRRFNETTGALTWAGRSAEEHPDRCVCQKGVTPHKHYDEAPFLCARCTECTGYRPAVAAEPPTCLHGRTGHGMGVQRCLDCGAVLSPDFKPSPAAPKPGTETTHECSAAPKDEAREIPGVPCECMRFRHATGPAYRHPDDIQEPKP